MLAKIESPKQDDKVNSDQLKLIRYLDDFGKQISNRKSGSGLQQQLASLSRAYNQAQQKLLQTQRALMTQSVLLEKQRSILEIYKYILSGQMEDDGILEFLQHLEEQDEQTQIYQQLGHIRGILNRKKREGCKKNIEEDRNLRELKKEVSRLNEERREQDESSIYVSTQNEELRAKLETAVKQLDQNVVEMAKLKQQLQQKCKQTQFYKQVSRKQTQQINFKCAQLAKLKDNQKDYQEYFTYSKSLYEMLKVRLVIGGRKQNQNKLNQKQQNSCSQDKTTKIFDSRNIQYPNREMNKQVESKLNQLLKYKLQYKKIKQNNQNCQFFKKTNSLIKLFLSDQALELVKQYQLQRLDCIETQLRNLAVLQKNKISKLQQCQRQIWKYKIQLMREENYNNSLLFPSVQQTLSKSGKINFTKESKDTLVTSLKPERYSQMAQSINVQPINQIFEFDV